jgi:3-methyladenine DNA glycosylase AlkD
MTTDDVLKSLERAGSIRTPELKMLAAEIKKVAPDRHALAQDLWQTGSPEARVIAFMIDEPRKVTEDQMDRWCGDFDNWGTVDGTCCYLFCRTQLAYKKAFEWAEREAEFEKRAAFALIAYLTVHDKKAGNETLAAFFPLIEKHAGDKRHFVKKAVNWALRQLGKRNIKLNLLAVETARRIRDQGTRTARWIAADALRELEGVRVLTSLAAKEDRNAARV